MIFVHIPRPDGTLARINPAQVAGIVAATNQQGAQLGGSLLILAGGGTVHVAPPPEEVERGLLAALDQLAQERARQTRLRELAGGGGPVPIG